MFQKLRILAGAAVLAAGLTGAGAAHAAVEVFDATGILSNGSILGGTVDIDLTAGQIVTSDLTFTLAPTGPYTNIITALPEPTFGFYDFNVLDAAGDNFSSGLHGASLVNYVGGAFCADLNLCNASSVSSALVVQSTGDIFDLESGALRPTGVFVPEPASLTLLLTGIAGIGVLRRRHRRAETPASVCCGAGGSDRGVTIC